MASRDFGHVKMSRKAFLPKEQGGDPFWNERRVFSRWEAWQYLINEAAYAEHEFAIPGGPVVVLERGETRPLAIRHLMREWGWKSSKRVVAFLNTLAVMGRIRKHHRTQAGDTYFLVNYDRYQGSGYTEDDASGNDGGTLADTIEKKGKKGKQEQISGGERRGHETWLTPYADAWTEAYGGEPHFKQLARFLKPLKNKHGDVPTLAHWKRYLANTEGQFASPARFSSTFGEWGAASVVSTEDMAFLLDKAGVFLHDGSTRQTAFDYLAKAHPDVWSRAGPMFKQLRFQPLIDLRARRDHNGVRRELEQQCRGLSNGRAA